MVYALDPERAGPSAGRTGAKAPSSGDRSWAATPSTSPRPPTGSSRSIRAAAGCSGNTSASRPRASPSTATPAPACTAAWCTPASPTATWWRSTPAPAIWCGPARWPRPPSNTSTWTPRPALLGEDLLLASSYSGGLYALTVGSGDVRWRLRVEGASGVRVIDGRLYFSAPRDGLTALTTTGDVLWRQGLADAGDLTPPFGVGPYLVFSGSRAGLFIVDRERGRLLEIFNPGRGMCAGRHRWAPTAARSTPWPTAARSTRSAQLLSARATRAWHGAGALRPDAGRGRSGGGPARGCACRRPRRGRATRRRSRPRAPGPRSRPPGR